MRKLMVSLAACGVLGLAAFGCSHSMEEAKADYHQDKAERAADHGRYDKAAREQNAADRDKVKADEAPLP